MISKIMIAIIVSDNYVVRRKYVLKKALRMMNSNFLVVFFVM